MRELHNILERALTLSDGQEILPESLQINPEHAAAYASPLGSVPVLTATTHIPELTHVVEKETTTVATTGAAKAPQTLPTEGLEAYLENIEKQLILQALESSFWNRTVAAKKLGMTFRSLRYRLKKFGLDSDGDDEE